MTADDISQQVRAFLAGRLATPNLSDDDDIFVAGGVNSLFALELVMYIEKTFAVELEDADLERDNLSSIGAIIRLVGTKKGIVMEPGSS